MARLDSQKYTEHGKGGKTRLDHWPSIPVSVSRLRTVLPEPEEQDGRTPGNKTQNFYGSLALLRKHLPTAAVTLMACIPVQPVRPHMARQHGMEFLGTLAHTEKQEDRNRTESQGKEEAKGRELLNSGWNEF